jgi:hypothetical protein
VQLKPHFNCDFNSSTHILLIGFCGCQGNGINELIDAKNKLISLSTCIFPFMEVPSLATTKPRIDFYVQPCLVLIFFTLLEALASTSSLAVNLKSPPSATSSQERHFVARCCQSQHESHASTQSRAHTFERGQSSATSPTQFCQWPFSVTTKNYLSC